MTRAEFAYFAMGLKTYYPRENILPNEEAVSLWYEMLQDLESSTLTAALRKWASTEKWPPTIADLRALCTEVSAGALPDWGEAWAEVTKAVHRYGWSRPQEAFDSMSPTAKAAAERLGWQQICESENPDTLRAQFRQVYEICSRRENEARQLPPALKEAIAMIGERVPDIKQIGGRDNGI